MQLSTLLSSILISIGAGMTFGFAFVTPQKVGPRYFLWHGLFAIAATTLGLWIGSTGFGYSALVCAMLAAVILLPSRMNTVAFRLLAVLTFFLTILALVHPLQVDHITTTSIALTILGSAALLGLTISTMNLGHWYLILPKLDIGQLKISAWALTLVFLLRVIAASYGLLVAFGGTGEESFLSYLVGSSTGIFLMMRFAWGLVLPALVLYMILATIRIRSTQSATGLLYVMLVGILGGEVIAQYLLFFHSMIV